MGREDRRLSHFVSEGCYGPKRGVHGRISRKSLVLEVFLAFRVSAQTYTGSDPENSRCTGSIHLPLIVLCCNSVYHTEPELRAATLSAFLGQKSPWKNSWLTIACLLTPRCSPLVPYTENTAQQIAGTPSTATGCRYSTFTYTTRPVARRTHNDGCRVTVRYGWFRATATWC